MIVLLDISTPESFLEFFSTIAVILVIGVLAILYIAYYLQTNSAKRRHAENLAKKPASMNTNIVDTPSFYNPYSNVESN